MVGVGEIVTAVKWVKDALTTPGGTAVVQSDEADWKQDRNARAHYPLVRRNALYVTANRTGDDAVDNPFWVTVECEGGFSGGANPPEMSDVKFYMGHHNTGDGTALTVKMEHEGDEVDWVSDRWMLRWRCTGTFKIRDDVQVDFRTRLLVDSFGMFHLESPWVNPASGRSVTVDGGGMPVPIEWDWRATFGTDNTGLVPMLSISFTRD